MAQHGTATSAQVSHALPCLVVLRGRQDPGDHVGVTVEILGRRMHDDVRAQFDRARQQGRRRGRVDYDGRTDLAGDRARRGNIGNLPGRVGRRFDPDQPRSASADFPRQIVERRVVIEIQRQSPRRREIQQRLEMAQVTPTQTRIKTTFSRIMIRAKRKMIGSGRRSVS